LGRIVKTGTLAAACGGLVVAWTVTSSAEPQLASPADGKAMIERAIEALKANEAAALKAFNDEKNKEFRDRDLYVYCFSFPDGNITAYQSPVVIGTNVKELKIPPNNPVGQHAYDAVAKAAEGEIVSFAYDFPKPGTKALATKETLEARIGKQACGVSYFKT
jgi:cytochrome c